MPQQSFAITVGTAELQVHASSCSCSIAANEQAQLWAGLSLFHIWVPLPLIYPRVLYPVRSASPWCLWAPFQSYLVNHPSQQLWLSK